MASADSINKIGVVGSGVMGSGIALTSALAGYPTILYDINQDLLDKALKQWEGILSKSVEKGNITGEKKQEVLSSIQRTTEINSLVADFIIEAIPENIELKHKVLREAEGLNGEGTIIASNTSTIPITRIAAGLKRPAQVVGMHFFNPANLMKLVEVIKGAVTSDAVAETTFALAQKMGKTPVYVKDEPGFIVNRVARHFYLESQKILEENGASIETIDSIMENCGFKMGPFKLMDLIGVDTNHEVTKSLWTAFFYDEKFRPSRIQQNKVDAGHFGRKTGRGFYVYDSK